MQQYAVSVPNVLSNTVVTGRVTHDVEMRFTPAGTKVANVSMAVARRWFDEKAPKGQEWKEETQFLSVAVWGDAADRAAQLKHGNIVVAEFSFADLAIDNYTAKDGTAKSSLKCGRGQVSRLAWVMDGQNGQTNAPVNAPAVVPAEEDIADRKSVV